MGSESCHVRYVGPWVMVLTERVANTTSLFHSEKLCLSVHSFASTDVDFPWDL